MQLLVTYLDEFCEFCEIHMFWVHLFFTKEVNLTSDGASTTRTVKLARAKLPAHAGNFTCCSEVKKPHTQFTCVTCSLPVKTGNYTYFYVASTSRRIHAIALNKARKFQMTSPAWCRLFYLQFAGEFTHGVIAECLQLQIILRGIAGFFACDCAGFFFLRLQLFCLRLAGIFTCDFSVFACKLHLFLPAEAGNFAC